MEITQSMVGLYEISRIMIVPASNPRDTIDINMVLRSIDAPLPCIFITSIVSEFSFNGGYDTITVSNVEKHYKISYLARKVLRERCNQVVKGLFEVWKLHTRRPHNESG
jgi:hypothetical protein